MSGLDETPELVHSPSYKQGFEDGYLYVVGIIEDCCKVESPISPLVKKVLNSAFHSMAATFRDELLNITDQVNGNPET